MKLHSIAVAASFALFSATSTWAQNILIESPVKIATAILTETSETTTLTGPSGGTLTVRRVLKTPFGNEQILAEMLERGLISGASTDWSLIFLRDKDGVGGLYATKISSLPVAVPADLATVPVFEAAVSRGTELVRNGEAKFTGTTFLSYSTCTINGMETTGRGTNGVRTLNVTVEGIRYAIEAVSLTMGIEGGDVVDGVSRLITGRIVIGKAKVSVLTDLP